MPGIQPGVGIGAEQQNQGLALAELFAQALQRRYGKTGLAAFDFGWIDAEQRIAGSSQPHHLQPVRWSYLWRFAVFWLAGRYPAHPGEPQRLAGLFGQAQMADVHRVEGAPEDAERKRITHLRRACRQGRRQECRCIRWW